jgi:hypothetical protein
LTGCDGIRHDPGESTIAWRIAVETRTHRRAVLSSGVRIGYAAPIVAASMTVSATTAPAYERSNLCDCYPPEWGFRWANPGGDCNPDVDFGCGYCGSCDPNAGSQCPPGTVLWGNLVARCDDGLGDIPPAPCHEVARPLCYTLLSGPV